MASPLLSCVLNSNWKHYEKVVTELKIRSTKIQCCLCDTIVRLDIDENHAIQTARCDGCDEPICAECTVESDVFQPITGQRHLLPGKDRFLHSFGFFCDSCGTSTKVRPERRPIETVIPGGTNGRTLRRARDLERIKGWYADFTWKKCRMCSQRCHERNLFYRITPWEPREEVTRSSKRSRVEFDRHLKRVKDRSASDAPTSPLALSQLTPDELSLHEPDMKHLTQAEQDLVDELIEGTARHDSDSDQSALPPALSSLTPDKTSAPEDSVSTHPHLPEGLTAEQIESLKYAM